MARSRNRRGGIRIIGGAWRGRRLAVADAPGLRPTPGRVRETLFNWLLPTLPGARCLDAFAGTGALGLEALSRGAASCLFLERDPHLSRGIRHNLGLLGATGGEVRRADALGLLRAAPAEPFDIAFLDPPFDADLWTPVLAALPPHLAATHAVYLEYPANRPPTLTPDWTVRRRQRAGDVGYCLACHTPETEDKQP